MPISDKVIELETKKKGRTAMFIVFIALLAAASVAFAVLWIVKAPATDPPAVEKIEVFTHDLYQSGKDSVNDKPIYEVSPGCSYTMEFDLVLKSNSDLSNTNGLIDVTTAPVGFVKYTGELVKVDVAGLGDEEDNLQQGNQYYRYRLNFTVEERAANSFKMIVASKFTSDVSAIVDFTVSENSHTEYFDLVPQNGDYVVYERNTPSKTTLLELDKDKTTSSLRYFTTDLIYYTKEAGTRGNVAYRLDFEQLGKLSEDNGLRAKIYPGKSGEKLDEVKVEAGVGDSYDDAEFRTITVSDYVNTQLTFDFLLGDNYYKTYLLFTARQAGKNYIKLTANVNNDASPLVIIIEVNFQSSDEIDKITEIVFIDPYTGQPTGTKDKATVNLFLGKDLSDFLTISDWIMVKRGNSEPEEADWNAGGLSGSVTANDLFIQDASYVQGFRLNPKTSGKTGSCTVTVRDTDEHGFAAKKEITVNVLSPIEDLLVSTGNDTKAVIVPTSSSRTNEVVATLRLGGVKFADVKDALYTVYKVTYPEGYKPVSGTLTGTAATNAAKNTFSIDGLNDKDMTVSVTPTGEDNSNTAEAAFKIKVGDNIGSGSYEFGFELAPQGLIKTSDGYEAIETIKFTVTLEVTHLADGLGASSAFLNDIGTSDLYTEFEISQDGHSATLTLGVATGSGGLTSFKVGDILAYYDNEGKLIDGSSDLKLNGDALAVSGDTDALGGLLKGKVSEAKFVVPSVYPEIAIKKLTFTLETDAGIVKDHNDKDIVFYLTIEYKMPVTEITVFEPDKERTISYRPVSSLGVLLNNGENPDPSVKPSINDDGELVGGDCMRVWSIGGAQNGNGVQITDGIQIKHEELLNFDIAVMRGTTARVLLPKLAIDESMYYFKPYTDVDALTATEAKAQAVFRVGYTTPLQGYNVTVLKDLFELSYIANLPKINGKDNPDYLPQLDYQKLAFVFSYGKVQYASGSTDEEFDEQDDKEPEISNLLSPYVIKLNERGIIQSVDSKLVAITYWNLVRQLDDMKIYEDGNYTELLENNSEDNPLWYLDNQEFNIYYSGIINLGELNEEFVVERDNHALRLACTEIISNIVENSYIKKLNNGRFTVSCGQGESKTGDYISFVDPNRNHGDTVNVYVSVSNMAVPIEKIEFFLTNPTNDGNAQPLENYVYWLVPGKTESVTIYYRITWTAYNGKDSSFEGMEINRDRLSGGFNVSIVEPPSYDIDPASGRGLKEGDKHTYVGSITISLLDTAVNGDYTFGATPDRTATAAVSGTVHVSKLIDQSTFSAIPDGNENEKVPADYSSDTSVTKTFTYEYSENAAHYFEFDFGGANADRKNLTYSATVISGIEGRFLNENNGECVNNGELFEYSEHPDILGYKLYLQSNARVSKSLLTITITQKYKVLENGAYVEKTDTYTIRFYVEVYPSVETLELTVTDSDKLVPDTTSGTPKYEFVTDGRKNGNSEIKKSYALGALVNGVSWNATDSSELARLPQNATPVFELIGGNGKVFSLGTDGRTLYVNTSSVSPEEATLSVTVGTKSVTVKLSAHTDRRNIRFGNDSWSTAQTYETNPTLDFAAYVYDAGDLNNPPSDLHESVTYTVNYVEQPSGFTVTQESDGSSRFAISGISGKFTVTASYTYTLGDKSETVSVTSGVITVNVQLAGINIIKDSATVNNSTINLTALQTNNNTFKAEAYYSVDSLNTAANKITKGFNVSSSDDAVANVSIDSDGVITVMPKTAGDATVTVSYGAQTLSASFTVRVSAAPTLDISLSSTALDVFGGGVLGFSVSGNGNYTYSDVSVSIDGNGMFSQPVANGANTYAVTLDKTKVAEITDALAKNTSFTVSATAKVTSLGDGYTVTAQNKSFNLTDSGYTPVIELNREDGELVGNNSVLEKTQINKYSFSVNVPDTYANTVKFESAQLEFADATVNPAKVSALKENIYTVGEVKVTVTVLGKEFTAEKKVGFTDSSSFESSLYYSDSKPFTTSVGELIEANGSPISALKAVPQTGSIAIDYETESNTYLTVITDYTETPVGVHNAGSEHFFVEKSEGLTFIDHTRVNKGDKWLYVAVYRVDTAGTKSVTVYTDALGGSSYRAPQVSATFTATAPVFSIDKTSPVSLAPGANSVITVNQTASGFSGNVTYTWTLGGNTNSVVSGESNGNKYTVSAISNGEALKNGANAIVTVTATVTSGVFANTAKTFAVAVNVDKYSMPTVTKVNDDPVWIVAQNGTFDLKLLFAESHDSRDTAFAYDLSFGGLASSDGSIANGVFTANGTTNFALTYTATLTDGLLKNSDGTQTLANGTINIIVAPVMTWSDGQSNTLINQGETVNLGVKAASSINLQGNTTVSYRLSNESAGIISGGVFTPSDDFVGSVTVYALATVGYGGGTGETEEISKTITVKALAAPEFTVTKPNPVGAGVYTLSSSVTLDKVNFAFEIVTGSGIVTVSESNANTFNVALVQNTMGGNVALKATMTVGNDCTYAGGIYNGRVYEETISFNVSPSFVAPDKNYLTVAHDSSAKTVKPRFTQDDYTADYAYSVIGSGIVLNGINGGVSYELVPSSQAQTARIVVTATITAVNNANPYDGAQFVWTSEEITIAALPAKPELKSEHVSLSIGRDFTATLGLTQAAQAKFKLLTCELAQNADGVTVANGIITYSQSVVASGPKVVVLNVYYQIVNDANYAGTFAVAENISVTLPAFPSGYGAEHDSVNGTVTLKNTSDFSYSYRVVCDEADKALINVSQAEGEYSYTFNEGAASKEFTLVITATVKSGVYAGYAVELDGIKITVPAEPEGGESGGVTDETESENP